MVGVSDGFFEFTKMVKSICGIAGFFFLAYNEPHPQPLSTMARGAGKLIFEPLFLLPSPHWRGAGGEVKMSKDKG
jgi:hypothetical protein